MKQLQRVLVTAGASGIGLEIARAFVHAGSKVHVCDIDVAALKSLATSDPSIGSTLCDVSNLDAVQQLLPDAIGALGGLDVLVNNAGIGGPTAPVETYQLEAWEAVLRVNLTGTFNVTRLAIPHLKQSNSASIIMMSALAGRVGYPNRSAYAVSKWGLIGFTKTLARELGAAGVRVNALLPGAVEGARMERVLEGRMQIEGKPVHVVRQAALASQSIQRFVDPCDIGAMVVFLASEAGRSISGQAIPIDGDAQSAS